MASRTSKATLDIQKEISRLRKVDDHGQWLQSALQRIEDAVNNLGKNTAAAPKGILPPPPVIQQLSVKTNGNGLVHAVINDTNPIQKGINYFVEYDTTPNFTQPHVVHMGASRSMNPVQLPTLDDDGNQQQFYFRAYSQYQGGKPSGPIHFGGENPTPVVPGGTQQMTLIPSTGSGTAQATGQQGGSGFGKVLDRPSPGPKRAIKQ
jgi:hypothetical protein